jgi:hypothetical protein
MLICVSRNRYGILPEVFIGMKGLVDEKLSSSLLLSTFKLSYIGLPQIISPLNILQNPKSQEPNLTTSSDPP